MAIAETDTEVHTVRAGSLRKTWLPLKRRTKRKRTKTQPSCRYGEP